MQLSGGSNMGGYSTESIGGCRHDKEFWVIFCLFYGVSGKKFSLWGGHFKLFAPLGPGHYKDFLLEYTPTGSNSRNQA